MTPIDPPPGLLDKVAEAIHDSGCDDHDCDVCIRYPEAQDAARAAWRAVAEGIGLMEEVHPFPVVGQRPRTAQDSGLVLDDTPVSVIERWTVARRLVSKWEPQP